MTRRGVPVDPGRLPPVTIITASPHNPQKRKKIVRCTRFAHLR